MKERKTKIDDPKKFSSGDMSLGLGIDLIVFAHLSIGLLIGVCLSSSFGLVFYKKLIKSDKGSDHHKD